MGMDYVGGAASLPPLWIADLILNLSSRILTMDSRLRGNDGDGEGRG